MSTIATAWALSRRAYRETVTVQSKAAHALVESVGGTLFIAFRGTCNDADKLIDLDILLQPVEFGRVHRGFLTSAYSLWWLLESRIRSAERVVLTGHSKGGAEAVVTALFLAEHASKTRIITFGMPAVGDKQFSAWVDETVKHDRFVNESDIVPGLLSGQYKHNGVLHWFDGKRCRPSAPWLARLALRMRLNTWPFIGESLRDHSIDDYSAVLGVCPDV